MRISEEYMRKVEAERDELRAQLEAVREWLDGFDKGRLAGTWVGTALMDLDNILQPDSGKGEG